MHKYSKTPDKGTILVSEKVKKEDSSQDQKVEDADNKE